MKRSSSEQTSDLFARLWWITLLRGIFALVLGLLLLWQPDIAQDMLLRFMAMYWIVSGVISLMWGYSGRMRFGLWTIAGIIGLVGGTSVLIRPLVSGLFAPVLFPYMLGVTALLAGLAHLLGGFRTGEDYGRELSWGRLALGIVEVGLGLVVLYSPQGPGPVAILLASIWAIGGGVVMIADAFWLRARARRRRSSQQ